MQGRLLRPSPRLQRAAKPKPHGSPRPVLFLIEVMANRVRRRQRNIDGKAQTFSTWTTKRGGTISTVSSGLRLANHLRHGRRKGARIAVAQLKRWAKADEYGSTALHYAAWVGSPANIAALLKAGAEIEAHDKHGRTALHTAARLGLPANIAALLGAGASGSVRNQYGKTPFDYAKLNDKVSGTYAHWALKDAKYK